MLSSSPPTIIHRPLPPVSCCYNPLEMEEIEERLTPRFVMRGWAESWCRGLMGKLAESRFADDICAEPISFPPVELRLCPTARREYRECGCVAASARPYPSRLYLTQSPATARCMCGSQARGWPVPPCAPGIHGRGFEAWVSLPVLGLRALSCCPVSTPCTGKGICVGCSE